jgi:diacylglycerol kinase (ATP)
MTPMKWLAVINPAAGRGRARRRVAATREKLLRSGLDVEVHVSASAADARARAREALASGRGLIACGGDGTVRDLAGLAAEAGSVLGIVPTGSGNDFARQLDIPRHDVDAALAVIGDGAVARVDLGRATAADGTSTWFTTVANVGFDAEANRWANTVTWSSGNLLYVLAVLRTLWTYQPTRLRVTVDGIPRAMAAWLVAVASTRTYANGMVIAPDAAVNDGLLDVCAVGDVSRAYFLRAFPSVYRGTHTRIPEVTMRRGAHVTIESLDPAHPLELWASGERVGPLPAELTTERDALRVMIPRSAS